MVEDNSSNLIGVVDCGTNTFNLIIYKVDGVIIKDVVYQKSIPVKLKEGGWNNGSIGPENYKRGVDAALNHSSVLKEFNVDYYRAIGTEGLRIAKNSNELLKAIKETSGIEISIISGDKEAEYIHKGVMKFHEIYGNVLIMDIGGGSVEFIIADQEKVFWKKSLPIGASKLKCNFHQSDILTDSEFDAINKYLSTQLEEVFSQCKKHAIDTLIGTSGSFETIYDILNHKKGIQYDDLWQLYRIPLNDFHRLYRVFLKSSLEERIAIPGMTPFRADMMVVSSCLIQKVLKTLKLNNMMLARTAIKEGVAYSILKKS